MSKIALKKRKATAMGLAVLEPKMVDTHRKRPKRKGGTYQDENVEILSPRDHMAEHGTLRVREEWSENLKSAVDQRRQVMKVWNKVNNQLLAYTRHTDSKPNPEAVKWLEEQSAVLKTELDRHSKLVAKAMQDFATMDAFSRVALAVPSIGPLTVAQCLVYIDLSKARHASSLWAYVGLDKPSHARFEAGKASGGNRTLRTALYLMSDSQIKGRGPYREVYDRVKARLEISEKLVKSRNTQGHLIEIAWKDAKPCHRHGAALRAVMKHYLADYWFVGREMLGLENGPCYAEAMLGGNHKTVNPRERGWNW